MNETKLCKDCRHYNRFFRLCKAPENGTDLVEGGTKEIPIVFARAYSSSGCGPSAKYFEPKVSPLRLLLNFLGKNHA